MKEPLRGRSPMTLPSMSSCEIADYSCEGHGGSGERQSVLLVSEGKSRRR